MTKLASVFASLAFVGLLAASGTGTAPSRAAVAVASAGADAMSTACSSTDPAAVFSTPAAEARSCGPAEAEANPFQTPPSVCGLACIRAGGFCCGTLCC
jgi:hypothetical protein